MSATTGPGSGDTPIRHEREVAVSAAGEALTPAEKLGVAHRPSVRLVWEADAEKRGHAPRTWAGLAGAIVRGDEGVDYSRPYSVLGGPGTGKTSLLIDTTAQFLLAGGQAENVMFVTSSKEAAAQLTDELRQRLAGSAEFAATGLPVRSVHSWAFALYRAIQQERFHNQPEQQPWRPPRLITGAEHDAHIRTLLRGHAEDGRGSWPAEYRPALTYRGFARQLRDLVLRATERGLSGAALKRLGEQHGKPMWKAAGDFMEEYRSVQSLAGTADLNASELLHATLAELDHSEEGQRLVASQREKLRLLVVDDAQNFDPAAAQLVERFLTPGTRTLIAGDPDQCVFHFRGANEDFLQRHAEDPAFRVELGRPWRLTSMQVDAVRMLGRKLPAHWQRVPLDGGSNRPEDGTNGEPGTSAETAVADAPGDTRSGDREGHAEPSDSRDRGDAGVDIILTSSETAEKLHVADALRRAHLVQGVAWEDMAVIVRSTAQISPLRRVLLSHGVPVKVDPTSIILAEQPMVAAFLHAVEAGYEDMGPAGIQQLLTSVVGGADPVMVRRVARALARALRANALAGHQPPVTGDGRPYQAGDCLADLVTGRATEEQRQRWVQALGPRELGVVEKAQRVVAASREAVRAGVSPEMILWAVWEAVEIAESLQERSLRGGTSGSQADQDLDAMMQLFDFAGDYCERMPRATIATFVEDVRAQELPTGGRDRRGVRPNAVEILPAHAAVGRQWEVVAVTGVQEDQWPAGPTVGGLFGQADLVDLLDSQMDVDTPVSRMAEALQEERRLFLVALSRARQHTVVTAVGGDNALQWEESRFIGEIADAVRITEAQGAPADGPGPDDTLAAAAGAAGAGRGIEGSSEPPSGLGSAHPSLPAVASGLPGVVHPTGLPRVLALDPLLAELRAAVVDTSQPLHIRQAAATNLAQLALARVPGAAPDQWWGSAEPSTVAPVVRPDGKVHLGPSQLEGASDCPLRTFLRRNSGESQDTAVQALGSAFHAMAQAVATGVDPGSAKAAFLRAVPYLSDNPPSKREKELEDWEKAADRTLDWLQAKQEDIAAAQERGEPAAVHTECALEHQLPEEYYCSAVQPGGQRIPVVLAGRADLIELRTTKTDDGSSTAIVYDYKTGGQLLSKEQARESLQLKAYQVLLRQPESLPDAETPMGSRRIQPGGAYLLYPRKEAKRMTMREQGALESSEAEAEFFGEVQRIASALVGPTFNATPGSACRNCDFAAVCPAQPSGKALV